MKTSCYGQPSDPDCWPPQSFSVTLICCPVLLAFSFYAIVGKLDQPGEPVHSGGHCQGHGLYGMLEGTKPGPGCSWEEACLDLIFINTSQKATSSPAPDA